MKLIHISDLHLGIRLYNYDLREDQEFILNQIAEHIRKTQPDAVVIAGDIYDVSDPSGETVELFDRFMGRLAAAAPQAELMVISGNHDSPSRLNLFRDMLHASRIHMIGQPPRRPEEHIEKITLRDAYGPVHFWLLPFVRPAMVRTVVGTEKDGSSCSYEEAIRRLLDREDLDESERNVLVSHQFYVAAGREPKDIRRAESERTQVGNIDAVSAGLLNRFDYAALGHIHMPLELDEFHRYCGTPLACSVSEEGQRKGLVLAELGPKGQIRTEVLPLTPKRQVRKIRGELKEVLRQASDDYVAVTLTDPVDLDMCDTMDRICASFPHHLDISREGRQSGAALPDIEAGAAEKDPFELCREFLGELDEEDRQILSDVFLTVQGGNGNAAG